MKQLALSILSSRNVILLLVCGGGILAFILLAILPNHRSLAKLDREIRKISARIAEQEVLSPIFNDLLRKARLPEPAGLPFPKKAKLGPDETDKIALIFQEIARNSNLRLESVVPDVDSIIDGSGYLMVNLTIRGRFFDFRRFLIQLGELPYLEDLGQIKIDAIQGSDELEYRLKIWLTKE
jgi:hypothetical protein